MGTATLGYPGGPSIAFRIDPEQIEWSWKVITNVVETIGGRVIQVLGARLDDLVITGSLGQNHADPVNGESWQQAEAFITAITKIMEAQSADSTQQARMHPPAVFNYPPKGWRFNVYVKDLADPDGANSVILKTGKINQRYKLTLFIVQEGSPALVQAGTSNGVLNQQAAQAVSAFMARISDGVGWHYGQFNGQVTGTLPNPVG